MNRIIKGLLATLVVAGLLPFCPPNKVYAISEGPSQPEAAQFEPVDTTDLVNLSTGDFTYNLPLLLVPGGAGDYPINLSYHAGIGPNEEATWVGLGWSLNPGSINRTLSGYPDDYSGDAVQTHFDAPPQSGWGVGIGLGYGPVGLNVSYDSYTGNYGVNAMGQLAGFLSLSAGTNGVSFAFEQSLGPIKTSLSVGSQGVGFNAGVTLVGNRKVGFTLSSSGSGANFSIAGVGVSSSSEAGEGHFQSRGFSFFFPLPWGFASLSYSEWSWWLDETYEERSYGYIHQDNYAYDFGTPAQKKYERQKQGKLLYPSQDLYLVQAQGIGGAFMPFMKKAYLLQDRVASDQKGGLAKLDDRLRNTLDDQVFRFLGDSGANQITDDGHNLTGLRAWGRNYQNISLDKRASKQIHPVIDRQNTWAILGFTITDSDGKTYEFMQPVRNHVQYSWTHSHKNVLNADHQIEVQTSHSYTAMGTPYATNWLLTAVKGPDYVDRNRNGTSDDGDWGFWVKFSYEVGNRLQIWRTPYEGMGPGATSSGIETASIGARDMVLLDRVETSTHIAEFRKSERKDRYVAPSREPLDLLGKSSQVASNGNSFTYELKFPGDWSQFLSNAPSNVVLLDYSSECAGGSAADDSAATAYQGQAHMKGNMSWRTTGAFTYITVSGRCYLDRAGGPAPHSIKLHIDKLFPSSYNVAKKLDEIVLYSKGDQYVRKIDNRWQIMYNFATPVKSVKFSYDYSLCPNTPNSTAIASDGAAGGKLTLKSVEFLGRSRLTGGMPPYVFAYGNGNAPGTGLNPSYNQDDWDNWGSYRSPGAAPGDRGKYKHLTPQDQTRANQAASWSLTRITTPTGGNLSVEYESDDYRYVSDYLDVEHIGSVDETITTSNAPLEERIFAISLSTTEPNTFLLLQSNRARVDNGLINENYASVAGLKPTRQLAIIERETTRDANNRTTVEKKVTFREIETVESQRRPRHPPGDLNPVFDGHKVKFSGPAFTPKANTAAKTFEYFLKLYPRKILGGGTRVKSITSSDGQSSYRTKYVYQKDGLSTGVTASLPANYGGYFGVNLISQNYGQRYLSEEEWSKYGQLFLQHERSYGRPGPGVIYSEVAVINVDAQDRPLNGQTSYRFITAKDYPYKVTDANNAITIDDRTGIYGKPLSISHYEQTSSSGDFRLLKQDSIQYAFSDQLTSNGGRVFDKNDRQIAEQEAKPLGLIQEKYKFRNEYVTDRRGDVLARTGEVEHLFENVYITGNYSDTYYYDLPSPAPPRVVRNESHNFIWDAISGNVIASANTYTNDGASEVKKIVPAYWKYEGMEQKNMLTQTAQETSYLADESIFSAPRNYGFPSDMILSSKVTTWSSSWHGDQGVNPAAIDAPWREDATFIYNKSLDRTNGSGYSPLPVAYWFYGSDQYPVVTSDSPWRMDSNVTKYDTMSHPIEVSNADRSYTSAVYGYENSRQIAVVKNAGLNEFKFFNFEEGRNLGPAQSRYLWEAVGSTGRVVTTAKDRDWDHAYTFSLKENQTYRVSFWARKGTADLTKAPRLNFVGQGMAASQINVVKNLVTSDRWEYIEGKIAPIQPGTLTMHILCGAGNGAGDGTFHLIDDIRILPIDATMRTFSYDPVSFELNAITDENNVITYYEYDNFGRLARVRDADRNIKLQYQYGFGPPDRSNSIIPANFIRRQVIKTPVANESLIARLGDQDLEQTVDYYSGLGKIRQEIAVRGSPTRRDLVTPITYNELGRATTGYLPYSASAATGQARPDAFLEQRNFYRNEPAIAHSDYPFAVSVEERSPLFRILEKGSAGEAWQPLQAIAGSGHTTRTRYRTNTANEVRLWVWNAAENRFQADNFHAAGRLSVVEVQDENGHTALEYRDRLDRVLLKRGLTRNKFDVELRLDTFYVYDEFGNLRFIVPPRSVQGMLNSNQWFIDRTRDTKWVTQFVYDGEQRVVEKRVGEAGPLYTIYDRLGRPVLTQDGNSRQYNRWLFTKYDVHGRPVMTGTFQDNIHVTRVAMQAYADNFADQVTRFSHEKRTVGNPSAFDTHHGYTNQAFPAHDPANVLTVTYYDDYDLTNRGTVLTQFVADPEFPQNRPFDRLANKVTAQKTRVISEGNQGADLPAWLVTYNYYDKYGRTIQTWTRDNKGIRIENVEYDFSGKILKQKLTRAGATDALTVRKRFTYDHVGRLLRVYQKNNNDLEVLLLERKYNELGGLSEKNLHSEDNGSTFLQSVDYAYNIRGWLTEINSPYSIGYSQAGDTGVAGSDQFGMRLWYEQLDTARLNNTAQYNGNLSAADWATADATAGTGFPATPPTIIESYIYTYDHTNQLTAARYQKRSGTGSRLDGDGQYNETISYDMNGNIEALSRGGLVRDSGNGSTFYGPIDELTYTYRGNQLIGVDDRIQGSHGADFTDKNGSRFVQVGDEYRYDASGNMIEDKNKGLTARYNHLNLPLRVDFGGGNYYEWIYSAAGEKLRQTISINGSIAKTVDYTAETVYENGAADFFKSDEGRVKLLADGKLRYEYNLTDHLGNVRVSLTKGANGRAPVVLQQDSYYPFGMKLGGISHLIQGKENKYGYNGKELESDLGLNWYDYGARHYDPQLGRWHAMDPADEQVGPYTYVANNPVRLVDPDGRSSGEPEETKGFDKDTRMWFQEHGFYGVNSWDNFNPFHGFFDFWLNATFEQALDEFNEAANMMPAGGGLRVATGALAGSRAYFAARFAASNARHSAAVQVTAKWLEEGGYQVITRPRNWLDIQGRFRYPDIEVWKPMASDARVLVGFVEVKTGSAVRSISQIWKDAFMGVKGVPTRVASFPNKVP